MGKNKSFSKIALMPLLTWGGISCTADFEDEIPLASNLAGIEIQNGTLKIPSFDRYEDLITGKEGVGELAFVSFQENFQESVRSGKNLRISQEGNNEITSWEGSPLLELLDRDGFIFIEDYLFYLDFEKRTVIVTADKDLKTQILQGDLSNEGIRIFSFDDDVIGILENDSAFTKSKTNVTSKLDSHFVSSPTITTGCSWDKCDNNGTSEQEVYDPITYTEYRLEAKHVYQAAGIYFRLLSQSKHMRRPSGSFLTWNAEPTSLYLWYDYEYKSKKRNSSLIKRSGQNNVFNNVLEPTYYSSSRGLERFYLKTQFYGEPGGNHGYSPSGQFWQFNLTQIDKGY